MSRIAKANIFVPSNVKIKIDNQKIFIEGKNGKLNVSIHFSVKVKYKNNILKFLPYKNIKRQNSWAQAGTTRSLVYSMILGVTKGFDKKLNIIGVGYRVFIKDNILNLILGFSHVIYYKIPNNIKITCPNQNEILIQGINKQLVKQTAAEIRSYRRPEPYKGKGIRYDNEVVKIKEAKKK